jgi:hypothetical protein
MNGGKTVPVAGDKGRDMPARVAEAVDGLRQQWRISLIAKRLTDFVSNGGFR